MNSQQLKPVLRLALIALLAGLYACGGHSNESGTASKRIFPGFNVALDSVLKSPKGIFRGLNLGMPIDSIKRLEARKPATENNDRLVYHIMLDSLTQFDISYWLNENRLAEIELDLFCKDLDRTTIIFDDLKAIYTERLGKPEQGNQGTLVFTDQKANSPLSITLSDDSSLDKGKISLSIYEEE